MTGKRVSIVSLFIATIWLLGVVVAWTLALTAITPRTFFGLVVLSYFSLWGLYAILAPRNDRTTALRFLLVSFTFLLLFGGIESLALVGWIDYRMLLGIPMQPWEHPTNILDKDLLHIRRPHFVKKGTMEWNLAAGDAAGDGARLEYSVRFDRNGFRNPVDYESADYVVIGDSFIEATATAEEDLINARLAELLGATVANLGQLNYGPQQELVVLRRFALPLGPRMCIWMFFEGNDLLELWRYRELHADWAAWSAEQRAFRTRSFTRNLSRKVTEWMRPRPDPIQWPAGVFTDALGKEVVLHFGYPGQELSPQDEKALEITAAVLAEANTACRQASSELLVVFIPTKYRIYGDGCTYPEGSPASRWMHNDLPQQFRIAVAALEPAVGFVDLTTPFQEAVRGPLLYHSHDTHWTAEAHRLAASIIAEYIRNRDRIVE